MPPFNSYPYCDPKKDPETRSADLISRLTLSEKVSLTMNDNQGVSRLALPPIGHTECTHGTLNSQGYETTLFPQAISVARSFDRELIYNEARAISDEVRGKHNDGAKAGHMTYPFGLICWAPVVNLCRDPRWGRCQEGYGEDPFLQAEISMQYVRGLQYGQDPNHIEAVATCKHFDVHTGPENIPSSRFSFDSVVSYRDWVETFQPAFKGCGDAGALSYMCSFNKINGVPACANRELLTDLLRTKWNFTGFVVSDCGAIGDVYSSHHFAGSALEAAEFCLKAGCDWNCGGTFKQLETAVENGYVPEEYLDTALTRQARVWMMLGMFDPPDTVPYNELTLSVVDKHVEIALQGALESIVLLENRNNILPLDQSKLKSIAIIGPCANDTTCPRGDYDPNPKYIITPWLAFTKYNPVQITVNYAPGCKDVFCEDTSEFNDALEAAKNSDTVIYVGGINKKVEAEGHDRSDIALPSNQEKLVTELKGTGKPLIVVLMHGAPTISNVTFSAAGALVSAGYGGQEAGNAIRDVLTGAYNPAGRLSVTWYTGNDQLPNMTDYNMSASPGRTYRYLTTPPLYYFGYGLSYTTFQYSDLAVSFSYLNIFV
jgi:beta-glucosidase